MTQASWSWKDINTCVLSLGAKLMLPVVCVNSPVRKLLIGCPSTTTDHVTVTWPLSPRLRSTMHVKTWSSGVAPMPSQSPSNPNRPLALSLFNTVEWERWSLLDWFCGVLRPFFYIIAWYWCVAVVTCMMNYTNNNYQYDTTFYETFSHNLKRLEIIYA